MNQLFTIQVGRLRLVGYLEGISLLTLILIAIPLKYYFDDPRLVQRIGPIHGALFLLYIIFTVSVGVEEKWKFQKTTWKVLLACIVPFGTFYIDRHILKNAERQQ